MKRLYLRIVLLVIALTAAITLTGCAPRGYIFADDEWSDADFNAEGLLLNGEFELDDFER